ncbi:PAS domain S-box protein [Roseomonas sp. KE2513]|uniref:PAS domain S-box protein n=1 Tax=Roseomonas sp. KE2513 TaxID=2479202 RepID=UPI0018DFE280|nr:PAS domain-containing protein [Roseomonas sp. KE2513]MBI0534696.1 PAS domain S-box protein [Roseomonas sp. KE2513]
MPPETAPGAPDLAGSVGALSAAILGAALDLAGLAALITDAPLDSPGPTIRYANAHFEAITGYRAAELIGHSPRILQGPRTDRAELDRLRRALETERAFTGATINYRKNGTSYTNEWIVGPVLGPAGELTHWFSVQRDAGTDPHPRPAADLLRPRITSMLETLRAIATRTLVAPEDGRVFTDRLAALGRAQAAAGPEGTGLETLLRGEAAATTLQGPPVTLRSGTAEPLALALHELAAGANHPTVTWRIEETPERRLHLEWRDHPAPAASGWPLIEKVLRFALGAETRLHRDAEGLLCTIELPLGG